MFFLKRAWLYVKRKLGKVVTIGTILFVVSTLVLTGLLIQSASNNTFEVARNKLGANVSYSSDLSSVMKNLGGKRPTKGAGFSFELPDDYNAITTKEIEYIASNSKYIKDYTISTSLAGEAVDFTYYNSTEDEAEDDIGEFKGVIHRSNANVNIIGVDKKENDNIFNSDNNTLVEGKYFSSEEIENGSNVIIIEQTIADLNELKIGDNITISKQDRKILLQSSKASNEKSTQIVYKVVGIYKTKNPTDVSGSNFMGSFGFTENTMYAPYTSILSSILVGLEGEKLEIEKAKIKTNGYEVQNVTFNLNSPTDINVFIEEVKNMDNINMTYRLLNANDAAYKKMVGPIENVAKTSGVLVVVVVLAGAFIIGLLSMLTIKDRKYELGVLLSLGESKFKIIAQLICEMTIVALVSFSLAALTSNATAQVVTNYLLNQEVTSSENETKEEPNNFFGGGRGMFRINNSSLENVNVEVIDQLTVKVNITDIIKMFGIGILIIILGNVIQASFVLRCRPKEILLESR